MFGLRTRGGADGARMTPWRSAVATWLAACLFAGAPTAMAQPARVVVAGTVAQTGALADLAADYRKGILLWQEDVNARGGLLGRPVELRLDDDASDAGTASAHYARLARDEAVHLLIGPYGSAASLVAAGAAEGARRPLVNASGASHALHRRAFRYVFHVALPYAAYGAGVVALAQRAGLRRMFVVARSDPPALDAARRLGERGRAAGLDVLPLETHGPAEGNFDAQAVRARAAGAEVWVAFGTPGEAAAMMRSLKRVDYAPPMLVLQGAVEAAFVREVGQDAEYAIGIAPYLPELPGAENAAFVDAYTRKWSAEPGFAAAQGYSAGRVLEAAVRVAGSVAPEALRAALATLSEGTPLGRLTPGATGTGRGATLAQVTRGKPVVLWTAQDGVLRAPVPNVPWTQRVPIKPPGG